MLVKLYNIIKDDLHYWELWDVEEGIIIHWGQLGEEGENKLVKLRPVQIEKVTNKEISKKIEGGYFYLEDHQLEDLIIQIPMDEIGEDLDQLLEKKIYLQELVNEYLGWTGNGHCYDMDIGSGTINLFAKAVEPHIAAKGIAQLFKENKLESLFIIALKEEAGYNILFPLNLDKSFTFTI